MTVNNEIEKLNDRLTSNKLTLNTNKSKYVIFRTYPTSEENLWFLPHVFCFDPGLWATSPETASGSSHQILLHEPRPSLNANSWECRDTGRPCNYQDKNVFGRDREWSIYFRNFSNFFSITFSDRPFRNEKLNISALFKITSFIFFKYRLDDWQVLPVSFSLF